MSKPTDTVSVVKGQQQRRVTSDSRDVRRSSEPSFSPSGMFNGSFATHRYQPQPLAPARQAQNMLHSVAPAAQNNMQWQAHHQQQGVVQQTTSRHSFASSMDLITPSTRAVQGNNSNNASFSFQPFQSNNLFRSSSHHTSHTAVAGDLLTMSRRALNPPPPNQNNATTKKRSATMSHAPNPNGSNASQISFTNANESNSTMGGNHQQWPPQQIVRAPQQHDHSMEQSKGATFPNTSQDEPSQVNGQRWPGFAASYVSNASSSTIGTVGDNDESHHQQRAVRRCRRSDSFEMMVEDG